MTELEEALLWVALLAGIPPCCVCGGNLDGTKPHAPHCGLDLALTMAGLRTEEERNEARGRTRSSLGWVRDGLTPFRPKVGGGIAPADPRK